MSAILKQFLLLLKLIKTKPTVGTTKISFQSEYISLKYCSAGLSSCTLLPSCFHQRRRCSQKWMRVGSSGGIGGGGESTCCVYLMRPSLAAGPLWAGLLCNTFGCHGWPSEFLCSTNVMLSYVLPSECFGSHWAFITFEGPTSEQLLLVFNRRYMVS